MEAKSLGIPFLGVWYGFMAASVGFKQGAPRFSDYSVPTSWTWGVHHMRGLHEHSKNLDLCFLFQVVGLSAFVFFPGEGFETGAMLGLEDFLHFIDFWRGPETKLRLDLGDFPGVHHTWACCHPEDSLPMQCQSTLSLSTCTACIHKHSGLEDCAGSHQVDSRAILCTLAR